MRGLRLFFAAVLLLPRMALAGDVPAIDVRTYRPSPDPSAGIVFEPTTVPGRGEWNLGANVAYSFRPVDLRQSDGTLIGRPITSAMHVDLAVGAGLGASSFFAVTLPFSVQTGTDGSKSGSSLSRVPGFAFGDLGLLLKGSLVDNKDGGLGLAFVGNVLLPTGDQRSFSSDRAVRIKTTAIADYSLKLLEVEASLGFLFRAREALSWPTLDGALFGNEIHWSFATVIVPGMFIPAMKARHRWELGVRGWLPASPTMPFEKAASALSPVLLSLAERMALGRDSDASLLLGVDIGLNDAIGVPVIRGIAGFQYAPRVHDEDHDGIPDERDQCPQLAEDKDGKEDNDGCPDVDDDEEAP